MEFALIIAHGSRSESSNRHFATLVQDIGAQMGGEWTVGHAFLEMAQPDIPEGLRRLASQGAESIRLLPYFLSPGRHVVEDIPAIVDGFRESHPGVVVDIAAYFGSDTDVIAQMLAARLRKAPGISP